MDNSQRNEERTIDIRTLFSIFMQYIWVILAAAVVAVACMFVVIFITYNPRYSATATLYILKQEENQSTSQSDFSLALSTIADCNYAIKSEEVLDKAIALLDISDKYTAGSLAKLITTKNPTSTRFVEVTVEGSTPAEAKSMVDAICTVAKDKLEATMGFDQVNIFKYGKESQIPSNRIGLSRYLIVGFIAAALVYTIALVNHLINDVIDTDDDFKNRLGLMVLGTIPDANSIKKHRGYYKKYNAKYGAYAYGLSGEKSEKKEPESKNNGADGGKDA